MVSRQSFGSSAVSLACMTRPPFAQYNVFLAAILFVWPFYHSFSPIPTPLPHYSSTDKSVWQVPGSIGVGAHGWRVLGLPAMGA